MAERERAAKESPSGERPDIRTVIVGTAGHVDHGKSTLVRTLTGIDPDRLPEERDRGMTIDMGFAPLKLPCGKTVGVIDVPGHERFVKNMVAGAAGIDVGLLVVDANEGVMPQTREHLEIMQLLGIRAGLSALTKVDTAGEELAALAEEDLRKALQGTFLEAAPIVHVSSHTGAGIPALRREIERACLAAPAHKAEGPFRMPIQRIFSAKGMGTVVTGVPVSGRVRAGDAVEVFPLGALGRVRGVQAYRSEADAARAGQSSALLCADLDPKALARGMVVGEPGSLEGATLFEARLHHSAGPRRRALAHLTTVRVHTGTAEAIGEVALLESKELAPGASALVQLRLREPVVALPGDRFIIRRHEESRTLGGGVILGAGAHRLKTGKAFVIDALSRKEAALADPTRAALLEETLRARGGDPSDARLLRVRTGLAAEALAKALGGLQSGGRVVPLRRGALFVHADALEAAKARLLALVEGLYAKDPLLVHVERTALRAAAEQAEDLFDAALDALLASRRLERVDAERLRKAGRAVALSPEQEALRASVIALFERARFQPPSVEEAAQALAIPKKREHEVGRMIRLLADEKVLVLVAHGVWIDRPALEEARALVLAECARAAAAGEDFSAAAIRDALGTTRKWLIPILEHFDATGVTVRRGSTRVAKGA